MMRTYLFFCLQFIFFFGYSQTKTDTSKTLSFLFIGDIMGHGPQISAAYDATSKTYSYNPMYKYLREVISEPDYTIANLEVTLAGPPYDGYPRFSSPDALAMDSKNNGIDAFVTANNHSCDRDKPGLIRTIDILDSFGIVHTGTFKDVKDRDSLNLLFFDTNGFRIGLLNYTYGTNGRRIQEPNFVNLIDTALIARDLASAKTMELDKTIVFIHWGLEYKSNPSDFQYKTDSFIFANGADVVIGSHPHVLQKMLYQPETDSTQEKFVAYSLGNFVSNQRKRKTDGGAMVKLTFARDSSGNVFIKDKGYFLTWVHKIYENGKRQYYILPAAQYETDTSFFSDISYFNKMKLFISDSRKLLDSQNINVAEYRYVDNTWQNDSGKSKISEKTGQKESPKSNPGDNQKSAGHEKKSKAVPVKKGEVGP